jgi:hypothetical protein
MVGVDPEIGSSSLHLWIAAGSAALLVAACAMAFVRSRTNVANALERSAVIAVVGSLGAVMAWAFFDRSPARDYDADRRALEIRAQELTAHSLAPGSALPCLDALAGESVEAACEKLLFASPATVAIATSYAAARLALLSDMVRYVKRGGGNIDSALLPLRRSLEPDRFGFLAHALAVRDGCTSQDCKALDVLHDSSRVRANLSAGTLDRYLDRYSVAWAQPPDTPVADATPSAPSQLGAQPPRKLVNIDFPTAASIPALSIMNPEPGAKAAPGAAANPLALTADTQAGSAQRRSRKPAATPPVQAAAPSAPAATGAQADPVWIPAPVAAPQAAATTAAPAANFASDGAGPIQLTPSPAPQ